MTVFDILTDTRKYDNDLFMKLTDNDKVSKLRDMENFYVPAETYAKKLGMPVDGVLAMLQDIEVNYLDAKYSAMPKKLAALMVARNLKTYDDVREFLRCNHGQCF